MNEMIYRYEAKGIQSYILGTNKLKEIKGGSALVDELPSRLKEALEAQGGGGEIVTAAAGGASVTFPDRAAAEDFAAWWPVIVDRLAPGLHVVQAMVPAEGRYWVRLQAALREDRNRLSADLPEAGPLVHRAPSTGLPSTPHDEELRDEATSRRFQKGDGRDAVGQRLDPALSWVSDLDELGSGVVGVVHADGNDLGKRLMGIEPADLRAFSQSLSETTGAAARQALKRTMEFLQGTEKGWEPARAPFPGRPVVLGGDDITMILRGDLALEFARFYLEAFQALGQEHRDQLRGPVTACAGVALVGKGYPFYRAHNLAEKLCGHAKKTLRGQGPEGGTPSALAFHRVTTSLTGSWQQVLDHELSHRSKGADGIRTWRRLWAGPYTLEEAGGRPTLDQLTALREAMEQKTFPIGPVREVLSYMAADPRRASDRMARIGQVLEDRKGGAWRAFVGALAGLGCDERLVWRQEPPGDGERCFTTPIMDALTWSRATGRRD